MINATHTPGPWTIDVDDGNPWRKHQRTQWYCVRAPGGGWIAQVPEPDSGDARLIAAAPEMLAALEAIAPAYSDALDRLAELGQGFGSPGLGETLAKARAAIEKATI
tara:strand:- start:281 stop:601 length:321 start_codon:yes stop_codon:yes gene_type:complete